MANIIEKKSIGRRTLIISEDAASGEIEVRGDYELITSEGNLTRSAILDLTVAEKSILSSVMDAALAKFKKLEGLS